MDTIFTTDKNNKKRYLDISVEEINEVWCIVKTTGQVNGKETKSMTEVPLGYDSATKRAKTMWKNANTKGYDRASHVGEQMGRSPEIHL